MPAPEYACYKRNDVLRLVPHDAHTILSVGCATGVTERELIAQGKNVIGIEFNSEWAREAGRYLDRVIVGDVETLSLPLEDASIDCIIYADVLEHLRCPETVLLRHRRLLSSRGTIIVSVPNMRFWEVVFNLAIRGDWRYTDAGILDRTHLRVFTPKSTLRMLRETGFDVHKINRNHRLFERWERYIPKARQLNRFAPYIGWGSLRDFFTHQLVVRARPIPGFIDPPFAL